MRKNYYLTNPHPIQLLQMWLRCWVKISQNINKVWLQCCHWFHLLHNCVSPHVLSDQWMDFPYHVMMTSDPEPGLALTSFAQVSVNNRDTKVSIFKIWIWPNKLESPGTHRTVCQRPSDHCLSHRLRVLKVLSLMKSHYILFFIVPVKSVNWTEAKMSE